MGRWEPNAKQRLQQSAMALFHEHGYADVTVAEIADRAGLTKRTFFNHFTDKREVLFADAEAFEARIAMYLSETDEQLEPVDVAVAVLTRGGLDLAAYGEWARARRDLIVSATELRERNLIKMSSLAALLGTGLREREVPGRIASFTAQAAVAVFSAAYDEWAEDTSADFSTLMQRALADLRQAIGAG
jgi:AcrR family transcriptional regulator